MRALFVQPKLYLAAAAGHLADCYHIFPLPAPARQHHLGRKALQPDVRETHLGHRAAQFHRATGGDGQRGNLLSKFEI